MADKINVLVYGLGAVGGLYGYILSRSSGVQITVVARSNYAIVNENGLKLESQVYGNQVLKPYAVLQSLEEASGPFDYIVFAHKAVSSSLLPADLARLVTSNTSIVILQNGVGTEEAYRRAFPETTIMTCALWISAHQHTPGTITHLASVRTPIGLYLDPSATFTSRAEGQLVRFARLLVEGGMPAPIYSPQEMQIQKWEKLVWNAAFNSLTALSELNTHTWLQSSEQAKIVTGRLMREIMAVAWSQGVKVRDGLDKDLIEQVLKLPAITSSMQIDIHERRTLEVDIIFGVVVQKAKEAGVLVPTLEVVSALLMGINSRLVYAQGH